jgi:CRISP-associated protein Cas1
MSTLYLDRKGCSIKLEGRVLAVYLDGARESTVPLHLLERVILRSSVTLDSATLARLADAGVAVVLFGGQLGNKQAVVLGRFHNDAARRVGQLRRFDDPEFRLRWTRRIVLGKLRGQRRLIAHALAQRPDLRLELTKAQQRIEQGITSVRSPDSADIDRLRGLEGAAAAGFFHGYCPLFAPELDFTGRNRRPPRDPVNAALSLGYSLLHAEAVRALHMAGLDPMVGFFHELDFGRASLASDLIEPLRPHVEQWVWDAFRQRTLRAEDFQRQGDACLLGKAGRQRYFGAFERFARSRRRLLRRWSARLARSLSEVGRTALPSDSAPRCTTATPAQARDATDHPQQQRSPA